MGENFDQLLLAPVNYGRNLIDLKSERNQPFIYAKGKDGISNEALTDELRCHASYTQTTPCR